MLHLPVDLYDEVLRHSVESFPLEACGILAGPAGQSTHGDVRVGRRIAMPNASGDPDVSFAFDPGEQLAAYADMDVRGEDPVVLYHSHPRGTARPSPMDIEQAAPGTSLWLIVSLAGSRPPELVMSDIRAWYIVAGEATEVKIRVVDRDPAHPVAH